LGAVATASSLLSIVVGVVCVSSIHAQTAGKLPFFEVVSIKPERSGNGSLSFTFHADRFMAKNITVKRLIALAYEIPAKDQIYGGPGWVDSETYHIDAKIDDSLAEKLAKLPSDQQWEQIRLMLQAALVDRFQLTVSHESKELSVFALVVAKNGPKLTQSDPKRAPSDETRGASMPERGRFIASQQSVASLLGLLSRELGGRIVLDQTGLKGEYDFTLNWTPVSPPEMGTGEAGQTSGATLVPETSGVSIFAALEDQLGLKLESRKAPVDVLVIGHVEKPSGN